MSQRFAQEAEKVHGRMVWRVAAGVCAAIALGTASALAILESEVGASRPPALPPVPATMGPLRSTLIGGKALDGTAMRPGTSRHGYAWDDREAGLVSVPVDIAFEVYLRRQTDARRGQAR